MEGTASPLSSGCPLRTTEAEWRVSGHWIVPGRDWVLLGDTVPLCSTWPPVRGEMAVWSAHRNWEELQAVGQVTVSVAASWFPSSKVNSAFSTIFPGWQAVWGHRLGVCFVRSSLRMAGLIASFIHCLLILYFHSVDFIAFLVHGLKSWYLCTPKQWASYSSIARCRAWQRFLGLSAPWGATQSPRILPEQPAVTPAKSCQQGTLTRSHIFSVWTA